MPAREPLSRARKSVRNGASAMPLQVITLGLLEDSKNTGEKTKVTLVKKKQVFVPSLFFVLSN